MRETKKTRVRFLGWEDPQEEGMATHSSILSWRMSWTEEPVGLQSTVSQKETWLKWLTTHLQTKRGACCPLWFCMSHSCESHIVSLSYTPAGPITKVNRIQGHGTWRPILRWQECQWICRHEFTCCLCLFRTFLCSADHSLYSCCILFILFP